MWPNESKCPAYQNIDAKQAYYLISEAHLHGSVILLQVWKRLVRTLDYRALNEVSPIQCPTSIFSFSMRHFKCRPHMEESICILKMRQPPYI